MLEKLSSEITTAMKSKDAKRLDVLRMMKSKIMTVSTKGVDEKQSLNILKTYVKNLKEAVEMTQKAGKNDEVAQLQYEISVVSEYLPAEADIASITKAVEAAIAKVNPQGPQDFGKIMKEVMAAGLNADGNIIKQIVNEKMKK
jgi:uncharacterized protein YqeY